VRVNVPNGPAWFSRIDRTMTSLLWTGRAPLALAGEGNWDIDMTDFAERRRLMVESQLRPSAIDNEHVLEAMGAVPREAFLPPELKGVAYGDEDILLGNGRQLIEPLVLGKLLQAASIKPTDNVLLLGCTTGYSAAVLSRIAKSVFIVDEDKERLADVERLLGELGDDRVVAVHGKPAAGFLSHAPYDVIVIAGAVRQIPEDLKVQLADGGRLVTVLISGRAGKVMVVTKFGSAYGTVTPFDAAAPEVAALRPAPTFTF
jgi:protein-L-isoaspartate(D-aspartate) O-methyltransferase